MKIRTNYVSNSSSSSFIIAVDEKFYGNFKQFLDRAYLGCETGKIEKITEVTEVTRKALGMADWTPYPEAVATITKALEALNEGMVVYSLSLDTTYRCIINLMLSINEQNGGDKMVVIYGENE